MIRSRSGVGWVFCRVLVPCAMAFACEGDMAYEDTAAAAFDSVELSNTSGAGTDTIVALPVPTPDVVRLDSVRRDSIRIAARLPRTSRPGTTVRVPPTMRDSAIRVDTTPRTVQGKVELQLDPKTFTPGDYLRVRLIAPGADLETWTNRNGEFSFENAPANASELVFLTGDKLQRVVYRQHVRLGAGPVARLPVVHIPIDSIKRPVRSS